MVQMKSTAVKNAREWPAVFVTLMNGKTAMQENSKALLHDESAGRIEDWPN
jgi:hypothetical protein